ncbi:hypothetical protein [Paenibacillus contaminans]|uniref:Uncharacterized protein n=1 Tax=Paenibacillus contaminans TaxID=450362 RepID=A0A329M9N9_9BACL|nr:hypothetical protein [Paenibacillus contaminans]RAV16715.1 hypothetical protein DQG23_28170 [Paenibacillus contaminans]
MKQILMFVMFASLLCWVMFAPIYKHVLLVRQAVLQKEVDYMLEIGANGTHGYVDAAMIAESRIRFTEWGFTPSELTYTVTTTNGVNGMNPSAPVLRGNGIQLEISYPFGNAFRIDRLVGMTLPPENGRLSAVGLKMSEYVP